MTEEVVRDRDDAVGDDGAPYRSGGQRYPPKDETDGDGAEGLAGGFVQMCEMNSYIFFT